MNLQLKNFTYKDQVLDNLAHVANVAQFISFDPELNQRFSCIHGFEHNYMFSNPEAGIQTLLNLSVESSVNVRSFEPIIGKSHEFVYGIKSLEDVMGTLRRLARTGLHTIVNETIDIHDGGISGVVMGDVMEFSPEDTPRCVEKEGNVSIKRELGLEMLKLVYKIRPNLNYEKHLRVEFSLHPLRRGYQHDHTIVWEIGESNNSPLKADLKWPNRFSEHLGDKTFGLIVAHILGLPVPETTVVLRKISPFTFGTSTGVGEYWIRTAPKIPVPGHFTTKYGWVDPFKLLSCEDPQGEFLASVLSQESIEAIFSGAAAVNERQQIIIEGVSGRGDRFMQGVVQPECLPQSVENSVIELYNHAKERLGPVRMEWVYDGKKTWVVQLHQGTIPGYERIIFPGEVKKFHEFKISAGLEELRKLVDSIQGKEEGIIVIGNIGITSHVGDILRRAAIPSRMKPTRI